MIGFIALWSHALAALLYGALAIWQLRHWNGEPRNRPLVAAFAVTSLWAIFLALLGPASLAAGIAGAARNFAFLSFMYGIVRSAEEDDRQRALKVVYSTVAGVIGLQLVLAGVLPRFVDQPIIHAALTSTAAVIGLTVAGGSLVLVHNLYGQAAPDSRWGIRLPAIALAGMWIYDLHLYTTAYLTTQGQAAELYAMRGALLSMIAPLFVVASRRNAQWKMRVSRAATFQSLSVIAILGYLVVMMTATRALAIVAGDWVLIGQVALISAMTLAALVFVSSGKARSWLSVMLAKHLFEHRYDYREEWLRFTRTVGLGGGDAAPLGERVVKALADIADSPSGLLLLADDQQCLAPGAIWNWRHPIGETGPADSDLFRFLEMTGHVIAFDNLVHGAIIADGRRIPVPTLIAGDGAAWAGVPLLHNDKLVGLVVLAHPRISRPLDWEDFDLFRTAGIQAASYLAEARSQEALADTHKFDEFNRRFAFIMHDIKNLVSQLSLVARNAERHAENPEFRADMIATLQSSVKKMNDLLARLSQGSSRDAEPLRPIAVRPIIAAIARSKQSAHPIETFADADATVLADPVRLEQAISHLVQNAVDASASGSPVSIVLHVTAAEVIIEVRDSGAGMSAEFIRTRLFQPFASTKTGGFGIGAYEARALVAAMGGRLQVESREGEGSRFIIILPAAAGEMETAGVERRRA